MKGGELKRTKVERFIFMHKSGYALVQNEISDVPDYSESTTYEFLVEKKEIRMQKVKYLGNYYDPKTPFFHVTSDLFLDENADGILDAYRHTNQYGDTMYKNKSTPENTLLWIDVNGKQKENHGSADTQEWFDRQKKELKVEKVHLEWQQRYSKQ